MPLVFYAGIGSRSTPPHVCERMTRIAARLERDCGYALRSGAADGADAAFEAGATRTQIFLPWRGFNGHPSGRYPPSDDAMRMAALHHPAWSRCTRAARLLHARNAHQVLGENLMRPSVMVVCYTPDGRDSGGTGMAVRIARAWRIPVYNIFHAEDLRRLGEFVRGKREEDA